MQYTSYNAVIAMATVSFRIDDELKERLDGLAEKHGLNVSHVFRQALAEKIDDLQHGPNKRGGLALSLKERLFLANQYRTLAALYPEDRDHCLKHVEALQSGYELHYRWLVDHFADGLSAEDSREVLDILDMYSDLRFAFDRLKDNAAIKEHEIEFPGFDGNYETERMAYAHYFTIDLARFNSLHPGIKQRGLNSHGPMLGIYRRMLPVWRERRKGPQPLTVDDVRAILDARYQHNA